MQTQILIVEDEQWAQESLSEQLLELLGDHIALYIASTVREAVAFINQHPVDLVFMDVHLGDGLSFDIFKEVKASFPVIFTTAFDQYALSAFKHRGYAYILKPFDIDDLKEALTKVAFVFAKANEEPTKTYKTRFLVKFGNRMKSIAVNDIAYFMADDKIVFAHTFAGDQYIVDETIGSLLDNLSPSNYFQINRKFIVHINSISEMVKISRNRIKLQLQPACNTEVVVSEERSATFQAWLNA